MPSEPDRHEERLEAGWRLALALCLADTARAERVVEAALGAQPDFAAIPADRVERLIVLRTREGRSSRTPTPASPRSPEQRQRPTMHDRLEAARTKHRARRIGADAPGAAQKPERPPEPNPGDAAAPPATVERLLTALAPLDEQPKEAWILVRVFHRNLRWASRAMDCSTSAVARHLAQADDALRSGEDDAPANEGAAALLRWLAEADFAGLRRLRSRTRSRRRRRRVGRAVRVAVGVALILAVVGVVTALIIQANAATTP